jgi:hypothetical protein
MTRMQTADEPLAMLGPRIPEQIRGLGHANRQPPQELQATEARRSQLSAQPLPAEPATSQPGNSLAERIAYSVAEVVVITGLSRDLLYDQMRVGNLVYLKVGRRRVITRQNLEAFLARAS